MGSPIDVGGQYPFITFFTPPRLSGKFLLYNRNMSKSKGWTLQSSLLMLWMEKTQVNNQTTIDDNWKTY